MTMEALFRLLRKLVVLLLCCAIAVSLSRSVAAGRGGGIELVICVALLAFVFWSLSRWIRKALPKERREPPRRPELPSRAKWIGRRSQKDREGH